MKLPKFTRTAKTIRITISMPESEADLIAEYATYYAKIHKEPIPHGELSRHIIKTFIDSDKEFLKFHRSNVTKEGTTPQK